MFNIKHDIAISCLFWLGALQAIMKWVICYVSEPQYGRSKSFVNFSRISYNGYMLSPRQNNVVVLNINVLKIVQGTE